MDHRGERGVSRRSLLLGAAGGAAAVGGAGLLVEGDVLPGRTRAYELLGLNGDGAPIPDAEPGQLVTGSFRSEARGGVEVGWAVSYPVGASDHARLPVLLILHGSSGDHTTAFAETALDRFRTLAVQDGAEPFVLAAADGAPTGWRPLPDGTDPSRMLVEEFLPRLADRRLRTDRLALHGWSLGGLGALRLAGLHELPVRSVTASSPAVTDSRPPVPDDLDLWREPKALNGIPVRIDCGRGDPFYSSLQEFTGRLDGLHPEPVVVWGDGAHTHPFWRSVAPAQLTFNAEHLA